MHRKYLSLANGRSHGTPGHSGGGSGRARQSRFLWCRQLARREGADERTVAELHEIGLDGTEHIAQQFGPQAGDTDLFIAMDTGHRSQLIARGVDENRVALMRSFDPTAEEEPSVADPYYGGSDGFTRVRKEIEASLPGLLEYIQNQLR